MTADVLAVTDPPVRTPAEVIVAGPETMLKVAPVAADVVPSLQVAVAVYVDAAPSLTEVAPTTVMLLKVPATLLIVTVASAVRVTPPDV